MARPRPSTAAGNAPPRWIAYLFGAFGLAFMALALWLPGSESQGQRWIGVLIGAIVFNAAILLWMQPIRFVHPARYAFAAALIMTGFAALGWWVSLFSTGPFTVSAGAGGASVSAQTGGLAPRIAFGFGATLCSLAAAAGWRSFWKVRKGAPPEFT
jgi:hypothetical protein